ncbi:male sterility protein [Hirsutella rhossiliensis]|uniref:Male sterility protein n=1 Tax=Hirsutella rhossiliensis TaxID=111463 RepID=A0A9P8SH44_9HYPO|nr:male sterility protein [Hirsutella rhossiliensis]KAH0961145.1 male sterility protein [Hirsutella rhossiliensis]
MLSAQLPQPAGPNQQLNPGQRSQQLSDLAGAGNGQLADKPYGRRLAINIIEDLAKNEPSRPFVFTPNGSEAKDGWAKVTYKQIYNAINHVAGEITKKLGPAPKGEPPTRPNLMKKRKLQAFAAPSADVWLNAEPQLFPYSKSFEEAQWDPMVVLHTSGSTGIPKPIVVSHGAKFSLQEWSDRSTRLFLPMPMFHAAAVYVFLSMAIFYGQPIALGIPERPLNSDLVIQCLAQSGADAALLPPSIMEELSHTEEGIETLRKLNFVSFGGGALSKAAGDMLVERGVTLENSMASTEHFPYPRYFQRNSKLWQYFSFNMDVMGADWRPLEDDDGVHELVFVRKDANGRRQQGVFYTFPDAQEWATKDIFKRHPDLPDHWMYQGRIDNIIVFSNGEKLNPVSIEAAVTAHANVKGAVVVGHQRFQPALLVEPASHPTSDEEKEKFLEDLWPLVEEINKETVAHGRINRSFAGLTDPAKPFPRAGKGSIQRAAALQLYKDEIDTLYENAWSGGASGPIALDFDSADKLTGSIIDLLQTKFGAPELEGDTDIFSAGIDSAQVIQMANMLRSGVDAAHPSDNSESVAPKDIYANPTPSQMAAHLLAVYTSDLPAPVSGKQEPLFEGQTVKKIVALNRGSDGGRSRQPGVSGERGLSQDFSKVEFVQADLSKPRLGVEEKMYNNLLHEADRIIHNAWPVNFNISVGSFEPHIKGVRHFVDFAAAAKKRVPVLFLSSVSTAGTWSSDDEVPETGFTDLNLPTMGYGRSKAVSSLILDEAREKCGLSTAVIRVGQIGGPRGKKGAWNKQEFYPSLVASATHLGVLPDQLGPRHVVDWVPIEDTASVILEIAGVTAKVPASEISGYYHACNPAKTDWTEVAHAVKKYYGDRIKKLVSLEEWLDVLEKSATDNADLEKNPSIKLLDTHRQTLAAYKAGRHSTPFETKRARENSAMMRKMEKINPSLVELWCSQWAF